MIPSHDAAAMSQDEVAAIEAELSPEQLQLFAEENDSMLRHYEDTLNKVQYVSCVFTPGRLSYSRPRQIDFTN